MYLSRSFPGIRGIGVKTGKESNHRAKVTLLRDLSFFNTATIDVKV